MTISDDLIIVNDMSRKTVIEGLRAIYDMAVEAEQKTDPAFRGWPDMRAILNHIEEYGLPARV